MTPEHLDILMREALYLANQATSHGDVPVGALVLDENEEIIGRGKNEREKTHSPEAHAEILAIREAAKKRKSWNLSGCSLVVTLEPCLMCTGAIVQSRLDKVYFGAYDRKGGAICSNYKVGQHNLTNHHFDYAGRILEDDCGKLLTDFFKKLRS